MDNQRKNGPHRHGDFSLIFQDPQNLGAYKVPVEALDVTWGNNPRFWDWKDLPEKDADSIGFTKYAILLQVNWIQVTGRFPLGKIKVNEPTKYEVIYKTKFGMDSFGWQAVQIKFKLKISGHEQQPKTISLEKFRRQTDVWQEIPGGEFTVPPGASGFVEFGMYETESEFWKGNLALAGIIIRPKKEGKPKTQDN